MDLTRYLKKERKLEKQLGKSGIGCEVNFKIGLEKISLATRSEERGDTTLLWLFLIFLAVF